LAEVERASTLGATLLEALGQRKQGTDGSAAPREADEQLAKAYELYFRTYDECRRAVLYLRWHEGDADEFAPSLRQSQRKGRPAPNDEPGEGPSSEPSEGPGDSPIGGSSDEPDEGPVAGEPDGKGGTNEDLALSCPAPRKRRTPGREASDPR
jgi:hypothetical protein